MCGRLFSRKLNDSGASRLYCWLVKDVKAMTENRGCTQLRDHIVHDIAVHIGQAIIASLESER
jgi:hypothetical protein